MCPCLGPHPRGGDHRTGLRLTRAEKEQRAKTEPQGTPKAKVEKKIKNEASFTDIEEKPGK